jgi:hypothetical protein
VSHANFLICCMSTYRSEECKDENKEGGSEHGSKRWEGIRRGDVVGKVRRCRERRGRKRKLRGLDRLLSSDRHGHDHCHLLYEASPMDFRSNREATSTPQPVANATNFTECNVEFTPVRSASELLGINAMEISEYLCNMEIRQIFLYSLSGRSSRTAKLATKFFDATGLTAFAAAKPAEMTASRLLANSTSAASLFFAPTSDAAASSSVAESVAVGAGVEMAVVFVDVRCAKDGVALRPWLCAR